MVVPKVGDTLGWWNKLEQFSTAQADLPRPKSGFHIHAHLNTGELVPQPAWGTTAFLVDPALIEES